MDAKPGFVLCHKKYGLPSEKKYGQTGVAFEKVMKR